MDLLLGIDIGTSGVKAVACTTRGRLLASVTTPHKPSQPKPGWSEQDSEIWWRGTCQAIRELLKAHPRIHPDRVAAIGLSGQLHGCVVLGADAASGDGRARELRPTIMWNDQRTAEQCVAIERAVGGRAKLVKLVGNAALPGFTAPKLLWIRKHEPSIWKRVRHTMLPKDLIRLRLTGMIATDVGDASGTLLFDMDRRNWSHQLLDKLDIDPSLVPPALESTQLTGRVSRWAASQTGLREGTPVAAGSGDNQCGAVGAGVVDPGSAMAMLGTSGVILAHSRRPHKDLPTGRHRNTPPGRLHCMCAATGTQDSPTGWCITGVMLSAAGSLSWCRDVIAPGAPFAELLREAAKAPPGSEGLLFLPHLTGERCPHPDPQARGAWVGLTSRHTRAHMVRSVIEGVTFTMGRMLDMVRGIGVEVTQVRLSGGGNQSPLWRQLQADIYNCPVSTTNTEQGGTALGAAILAGVGVGAWSSVSQACREAVKTTRTLPPSRNADDLYTQSREIHTKLYDDLKDRFHDLAASSR